MRWSPSISQYCLIAALLVLLIGSVSRAHTLFLINQIIEQVEDNGEDHFNHVLPSHVVDWSLDKAGTTLRDFAVPFSKTADSRVGQASTLQHLYDIRTGLIYLWLMLFLFFIGTMVWLTFKIRKPFDQIKQAISDLSENKRHEPIYLTGSDNVVAVSNELERLRVRLVSSDIQRNLFLRHVAHEIKTPLSTIKEATTLLEDQALGAINPDQQEIIAISTRATKALQRSIENLLAYNSLENLIDCQEREEVDLSLLLENVLSDHKLSIQRTGIRIKKDLESIKIHGDRKQISTVFDNLLSNAIKFAPPNSEIRLWLKMPAKTHAEFTIRDQGPGIAEEHVDSIFEAYFMGDDSSNAAVSGTGIGLSLAKQYVEAHNGSIELLESLNGASFRVKFGLKEEHPIADS